MVKISRNNDDSSFYNKTKFEELLIKSKSLGKAILRNYKKQFTLGLLSGCLLISGFNIFELSGHISNGIKSIIVVKASDERINKLNDTYIQSISKNSIVSSRLDMLLETNTHHFYDNYLYDKNGNITDLTNFDGPLYFIACQVDSNTLSNINLKSSKTKQIIFDNSPIDNNCLSYLPETVESLSLNRCNFITDANSLVDNCPNLSRISINSASALSDLSFIYKMPNLKEISIVDSPYITQDLLDYLRSKNINTNIDEHDVENSKKIDEIIGTIITPNMKDKEKINAVVTYVLNNVSYDTTKTYESNVTPLSFVLENKTGVCASYSYLTNVLLNKAGINSFEVHSNEHGWNLINMDDKYYYIDTTNMDNSILNALTLKLFDVAPNYMFDPRDVHDFSAMAKPTDYYTKIPIEMVNDIQSGKSDRELSEKYGSFMGSMFGSLIMSTLSGLILYGYPTLVKKTINVGSSLNKDIKNDYELIKSEEEKRYKVR